VFGAASGHKLGQVSANTDSQTGGRRRARRRRGKRKGEGTGGSHSSEEEEREQARPATPSEVEGLEARGNGSERATRRFPSEQRPYETVPTKALA
jgi:hypothetical protein